MDFNMNLLPIVPNCKCLITYGKQAGQETTAIRTVKEGNIPGRIQDRGEVWQITTLIEWKNIYTGDIIRGPYLLEKYLMRIDGIGEFADNEAVYFGQDGQFHEAKIDIEPEKA